MARDDRTLELIKKLKDTDAYIYIPDLIDRFVKIDDLYRSTPWNLKQIMANIDMVPTRYIPMDTDPNQIQQITSNLHSDPKAPKLIFDPEEYYEH